MSASTLAKPSAGKGRKNETPKKETASAANSSLGRAKLSALNKSSGSSGEPRKDTLVRGEDLNFREVYSLPPMTRIEEIKKGVQARKVTLLAERMGMPKDYLLSVLRLHRSTIHRKERSQEMLTPDESERYLGIEALIGQVENMIEESGNPEGFDAPTWISDWLNTPVPALNGKRPAEFLDTVEGQKLVSKLLAMSQTGAYA